MGIDFPRHLYRFVHQRWPDWLAVELSATALIQSSFWQTPRPNEALQLTARQRASQVTSYQDSKFRQQEVAPG